MPYPYPHIGNFDAPILLTTIFGIFSVVWLFLFIYKSCKKPLESWKIFFALISCFLLFSEAITVYNRIGFDGIRYLYSSRYQIYPALIISIVYLTVINSIKLNKFILVIFSMFIIFEAIVSNYLGFEGIINQSRKTFASYNSYLLKNNKTAPLLANLKPVDSEFSTNCENPILVKHVFVVPISKVSKYSYSNPWTGMYLMLSNAKHQYIYPIQPLRPYANNNSETDYFSKKGIAQIPEEDIEKGNYQLTYLFHTQLNQFQKANCTLTK